MAKFSWKRASGLTSAKRKFAKAAGIPTTRSGRQRKVGKMVTGGGCCVMLSLGLAGAVALARLLS